MKMKECLPPGGRPWRPLDPPIYCLSNNWPTKYQGTGKWRKKTGPVRIPPFITHYSAITSRNCNSWVNRRCDWTLRLSYWKIVLTPQTRYIFYAFPYSEDDKMTFPFLFRRQRNFLLLWCLFFILWNNTVLKCLSAFAYFSVRSTENYTHYMMLIIWAFLWDIYF